MMGIGGIQQASLCAVGSASSTPSSEPVSSLLPEPEPLPADPLIALTALQSQSRSEDLRSGMKDVFNNKRLRKKAFEEYKKAIRRAKQKRKKGRFWRKTAKLCGKLGKYGAVVAAVAIAVGTGGVGTPAALAIVGASLSSASLLQSETHFLQKMGMSDDLACKVEIGFSVGGAVCTGGAGTLAEADATLEAAQQGVTVTSGAATTAEGAATVQEGRLESQAQDSEADALQTRLEDERLRRAFDQILDHIQSTEDSENRAFELLTSAIEARDAACLVVARRV